MPDIEVTDEMIEAGMRLVEQFFGPMATSVPPVAAAAIYRAMRAKERERQDIPVRDFLRSLMRERADAKRSEENFLRSLRPPHDIPIPDA